MKANADLAAWGELAVPALQQALDGSLPLEARRRVEVLLDNLQQARVTGESLRAFRGVELLERLATPAAKRLLEMLAAGTAEARLSQEARRALNRLATRSGRRGDASGK
jgi:hypothetical protein